MTGYAVRIEYQRLRHYRSSLALLCCSLASPGAFAASVAVIPEDANSLIEVVDVRSQGDGATLLYYTYPDRTDTSARSPCPVNFYIVTLQTGLQQASPTLAASGICGVSGTQGRLLADGGLLVLAQDRLQHWRDGKLLAAVTFTALEWTSGLDISAAVAGQLFDLAATGDGVVAVPITGGEPRRSLAAGAEVVGFDLAGESRWRLHLGSAGERLGLAGVHAGDDGGALLYVDAMPVESTGMAVERRLYPVSARGKLLPPIVLSRDQQPDMASLGQMKPEDMHRLGELLQNSYLETIRKLSVAPRAGGGFDVLFDRNSGNESREGHYLFRIDHAGQLERELALTDRISGHGLDPWVDFRIEDGQLVLLSQVSASQQGVQARRTEYPQNAITRMSLDAGAPQTRLVPLDRQYLAAVMNAGDEQLQRIDNRPGGEPVLLGWLGQAPLAVSVGYLQRRAALRLDEGSEQLPIWDEVYEARQAELAWEQSQRQDRDRQQAGRQQLNADMAAAAGMTPEAYAALSNAERREVMLRSGDLEAVMVIAQAQAAAAMQALDTSTMDPQTAAALQQAMAGAGMDPAMLAGDYAGAGPVAQSAGAATASVPGKVLAVDARQRGFIGFEHPDGAPVTLLVSDRNSNAELLRKRYDDGVIYEYVDFSRFKLPLAQISVQYLDAAGDQLEDLTPAISR